MNPSQDAVPSAAGSIPAVFSVPFRRNRFFTGREQILVTLRSAFISGSTATLTQAVSGLGGIGKTQLAIEYAYRYRDNYGHVFFINAATKDTLLSSCVEVARLMRLPEADQQDQNAVVDAVKLWLSTNGEWLLIIDNADDLIAVQDWLPTSGRGHTLLTTRVLALGDVAEPVVIRQLSTEEGALFLLRRARKIGRDEALTAITPAEAEVALAISGEVDGLPLALDQAGAYIEETSCSLMEYWHLYKAKGEELRAMRGNVGDHASVTITFALAYKNVERVSPATAELLQVCAFLAPDNIPEEILVVGSALVGKAFSVVANNSVELGNILRVGINSSLIARNGDTRTISIHRVLQEVIKDQLNTDEKREVAKRTIRIVDAGLLHHNWLASQEMSSELVAHERLISQEIRCHALADEYDVVIFEAARVLYNSAIYLMHHALYRMAEPLLTKALNIILKCSEALPMSIAHNMNDLARVRYYLKMPNDTETLYEQAIEIAERELGSDNTHVGIFSDNLAAYYHAAGLHDKALEFAQKAFSILEKSLGYDHRDIAVSLNNLAALHLRNGQEDEAEQLLLRSEAIIVNLLGSDYYELALPLQNRASLLIGRGQYAEAETLLKKCVSITEAEFGRDSARLVLSLNRLAYLYMQQSNLDSAETMYTRVLQIVGKTNGASFQDIVEALNNVAVIMQRQERHDEAKSLLESVLLIREHHLGKDNPETAQSYKNLGVSYFFLKRYEEAENLYKKSLAIREIVYGSESPVVDMVLSDYINLLLEVGREDEAKSMIKRSDAIRAKYKAAYETARTAGEKEPSS